ncbi:unnamed protein product [Vitrella brassicaformis CCMP3155]|uniref:Uncharacterized protein n=1 Tax=Vitrella brassicaformis (strain CCMP3155) TaxID=1169540 RepID=A0A0G4FB49_VITBC|nr:unnamed protein product [Vitrella brassicaformis CCMP3155]|eukprot:CEM10125.1 unnamed protein product [Vitrella brassicaformis CCMP3155]
MQAVNIAVAALVLSSCNASTASVTPVQKVVQLLQGLQDQVKAEGKSEAAVYEEYACFCKEQTANYTAAIADQQTDNYQSTIEVKTAEVKRLGQEIVALNQQIASDSATLDDLRANRTKEDETYGKAHADLTSAINSIMSALAGLETSKSFEPPAALMQTITRAAKVYEPDYSSRLGEGDYDFRSDSVLDTLKSLQDKFEERKHALEQEEITNQQTFTSAESELTSSITEKQGLTQTKTQEKSTAESDLQTAKGNLATEQRAHDEDTESLRSLTLVAIAKALAILQGTVQDLERVNLPASLQQPTGVEAITDTETLIQRHNHTKGGRMVSFIQRLLRTRGPSTGNDRQRAVSMLMHAGQRLNSTALYSLAIKIDGDPFAKVKKLIQDLIQKMLQQANEAAEKNGYCESNIADNTKAMELAKENMDKLQALIDEKTARRGQLQQMISDNVNQVAHLNTSLVVAADLRNQSRVTNANTIADARKAADAVHEAMDVLSQFYKTAAKAGVLAQLGMSVDASHCKSLFSEPYTGSQGAGSSVIEVLETIRDNFIKTNKDTKRAEEAEQRDFVEYRKETLADMAGRQTDIDNWRNEIKECTSAIIKADNELDKERGIFDSTSAALEALRLQCEDRGSWVVRARREHSRQVNVHFMCVLPFRAVFVRWFGPAVLRC